MRRALVIAAVTALALARPETYKEKEDFQYSRSSSDEGTKSGFYGAQRGNMGGNYERAHNMDTLAQHQMGGLVRTVDGDLGDGAKQRSGSVFSAANSRGVYGSGHYDLSNVQGRNFQEGLSFENSQSLSALSSQAGSRSQSYSTAANSAYGSQSQNSRYHGNGYRTGGSDQALYSNNMQSVDNLQSASQLDGAQSSQGYGYHSQSGHQAQSTYDQAAGSQLSSNAFGSSGTRGAHYRLVGASPVRVYIRPGSTIAIPVAAQSYDAAQGSASIYDQNSQSSVFNQNSINSDTETSSIGQQGAFKPTNGAKSYEASYSYRKEWEKHDTVTNAPLVLPTVNPYPSKSELYEDTQAQGYDQREASAQEARNVQSSSQYRGYNTKSASSRQQAAYNSRAQDQSSSSDTAAASGLASSRSKSSQGAYNYGASANLNSANLNSQVEDFSSKPKSYQSSYSYHKSWERQGDPYYINPSTNGLYTAADSQASQRLTSSSLNQASSYGSQQYGSHNHQSHQGYSSDCDENGHIRVARSYNLGRDLSPYQQSQNTYEGQEYVGQQSQNLEDLGQQSQNLEDLGQQSQNLEDLGQQSQNLQDFGQQSQNLHDFGQQSQNLEDLGQQSQNLENLGQQSQKLEDLGQESQNIQSFGQESQNLEDFGQQTQAVGQLNNFETLENLGQQTQNQWDQQSQTDAGQQTQNTWNMLETIQHSHGDRHTEQQSNFKEHTGFSQQETQGSVFEISPSLTQYESHTTQNDKQNPFAHTIFDQHRPEQETIESGKDTEKEFPQLDLGRQPEQQTQFHWQPIPPNNQNLYVPMSQLGSDIVRPEVPDWQKHLETHNMHVNTGYGHEYHNHYQTVYGTGTHQTSYNPYTQYQGYVNTGYINPTVYTSSYGHNYNTQYPGNVNVPENVDNVSNTHVIGNKQSTNSTSNITTALTDVWDLIDDIEKQTTSGKDTDFFYHTYKENKENFQNNSNIDLTQSVNKDYFGNEDKIQQSVASLPSTTEPNVQITTTNNNNLRTHDVERGDIEPEKQKPQEEAGRGDIGPEDNVGSNVQTKPLEVLRINPTKPTLNKSPEEIETLSLTKENNKTTVINSQSTDVEKQFNLQQENNESGIELGVLSLDNQKKVEHHSEQDNWKLQSDTQKTTSTTPKTTHQYENPKHKVEQVSQQNTDKQQGQGINIDQQNYNHFESVNQQHFNLDQQNTDHKLDNFDQQGENLKQEHNMEQQFETFDQQNVNLDQQNIEHNVSTIEHGPDEIQQNTDQQFETLGQQTEDLNKQSFNQNEGLQQESIGEFGQPSENLGQEYQKFDNFGQQSESLGQEHQKFDNFGHQSENLGQEHQKFNNLGQQSENLGQEHQKFDNIGQQSENLGQEHQKFDNFGQQSENLGQEPQKFDNFGQQSEGFQQESLGELGQLSVNLGQEHQNFDNFGQQSEGFQQESLGEFGQQSANLGQEHQKYDSNGQQSEGFQQESLNVFGQHEQLQQESLTNVELQNENLNHPKDQQLNKWDKENENLDQQSQSQDLWKPNSEQQSSQVETFVPTSPYNKEGRVPVNKEPVVEPEFVTQKTSQVDTPPEPVTEKVGFWNKVGSKFENAKVKVKSWFSSS